MVTVLQTDRLLLRRFETGDGEHLHAITGDPVVMRFVGDLKPFSPQQTRTMIEDAMAHYEQRGFGEYAITCKTTRELIGYGGFTILPERAYPDIDYIFRPDQWGRGLASELAHRLVRYAFGELGFEVLGASFDPHNHASMHVAAKAGFQFARTGLDEHGLPTLYYELRRPVRASGSDTARRLPPTA